MYQFIATFYLLLFLSSWLEFISSVSIVFHSYKNSHLTPGLGGDAVVSEEQDSAEEFVETSAGWKLAVEKTQIRII